MRIEQPIAVIARNVVSTIVREIEAVVSLAVAVGYQALGNCLFGNDSLQAMQISDLHRSWGSHAPTRTTAVLTVTTCSLPVLRHQHKPMLVSCLTSSQLPENQRNRAAC
ncbi:hypothetical protein LF1_24810 [Rubripirellula obstinata]|uniref:Uncharacterized protein n=1 Tax=Rubripirellula obstinata TaxID=406547 RepID=A0A5B1CKL7_9BACT|nr:hypothetical protein [Rubripirellula obstinata]KAA1259943.1 hypothetical protein LF1_24810 [Rubripirellula obstinata]